MDLFRNKSKHPGNEKKICFISPELQLIFVLGFCRDDVFYFGLEECKRFPDFFLDRGVFVVLYCIEARNHSFIDKRFFFPGCRNGDDNIQGRKDDVQVFFLQQVPDDLDPALRYELIRPPVVVFRYSLPGLLLHPPCLFCFFGRGAPAGPQQDPVRYADFQPSYLLFRPPRINTEPGSGG